MLYATKQVNSNDLKTADDVLCSESCDRKFCAFGAECIVDDNTDKATCRCVTHCDVIVTSNKTSAEAVCGSNNKTYASECELRFVSCDEQKRIRVRWRGTCGIIIIIIFLLLFIIIIIINVKIKIKIILLQKKCCRGTVQNVMSKFAVNAVQQIDSAIMSDRQRMP